MTHDQYTALKNKFNGTYEGLTRLEQQQLLDEVERLMKLLADVARMKGAPERGLYVPVPLPTSITNGDTHAIPMQRAVESNERIVSRAARLRHANERGGYPKLEANP